MILQHRKRPRPSEQPAAVLAVLAQLREDNPTLASQLVFDPIGQSVYFLPDREPDAAYPVIRPLAGGELAYCFDRSKAFSRRALGLASPVVDRGPSPRFISAIAGGI